MNDLSRRYIAEHPEKHAYSFIETVLLYLAGKVFSQSAAEFCPNDGFRNILNIRGLQAPEYLMKPWTELTPASQAKINRDGGLGKRYETGVDEDTASGGWQAWAPTVYTAMGWLQLRSITDKTGPTFKWTVVP